MSTNNEVHKIDAETVLHDVLDVVFRNLCAKDLLNAATVCKSWHWAALREKSKRNYIRWYRFHYQTKNLASKLHVIPSVSVLYYSPLLKHSLSEPISIHKENDVTIEILENFQPQLPNETIVLRSDMVIDSRLTYSYKDRSEILGLFFPSVGERIRVHIAICDSRMTNENSVDRIAEELGMNNCPYPKSTILLFYSGYMNDRKHLAELYKREQQKGKEITWASFFGSFLTTSRNRHFTSLWGTTVALRISGLGVDSWSSYIHCFSQHDEIERKLQKLKEKVKPKRYNIGLMYTRNCFDEICSHGDHPADDSYGMMNRIKRFFPDIRFTGFIQTVDILGRQMVCQAIDQFNEDFLGNLSYYVSIIIISYD